MESRTAFLVGVVLGGVLAGTLALAQGDGVKTGYAPVNGLRMYYEIHSYEEHGSGIPLIVLHGGIGSTEMFSEIMPALSARRQVIAVDLQAHGRTGDIDRPLSYEGREQCRISQACQWWKVRLRVAWAEAFGPSSPDSSRL